MPALTIAGLPAEAALAAASPDCDWIAALPTLQQFDMPLMPVFVSHALRLISELSGIEPHAHTRAFDGALYEAIEAMQLRWTYRMREFLGEAAFKHCAFQFCLHSADMARTAPELKPESAMLWSLRDLVVNLVFPWEEGDDAALLFSHRDRMALLCSSVALAVTRADGDGWVPSIKCDHAWTFSELYWPAFDQPLAEFDLRPLCRQLAGGQVWLLADGSLATPGSPGAAAHRLRLPRTMQCRARRLRGTVVESLRRGWISLEEAEGIIALDPLLEPWYLLADAVSQDGLAALTQRLRARFPQRLEQLAGPKVRVPSDLMDLQFDVEKVVEWNGSYATAWSFPRGSAGLIGVLQCIEAGKGKLGTRDEDAWTDYLRHLAVIHVPDDGDPAALLARLRQFSKATLGEALPWSWRLQPLVLQALKLGHLEALRCWLIRHAGEDPRVPRVPCTPYGKYGNTASGLLDLAGLLAAVRDVPAADCARLVSIFVKAGMLKGMNKLFEAATGKADRAAVTEAALGAGADAVVHLGLLPALDSADVRARYALLQALSRQARGLNSQRRGTLLDALACGLGNLAQVAGLADRAELEWECESECGAGAAWSAAFAPRKAGSHTLWIEMQPLAPLLVIIDGAGKRLKATPRELKNDPALADLQASVAEAADMVTRLARLLERRMAGAVPLPLAQLTAALAHPVMGPLLASLDWIDTAGAPCRFDDTAPPQGAALTLAHNASLVP